VLRALASIGIFSESDGRIFSHTPLSEGLRSDSPAQEAGYAVFTLLLRMPTWAAIAQSLRSGKPAFEGVFGKPFSQYRAAGAEGAHANKKFAAQNARLRARSVAEAYDFSRFAKIVDVGGGTGVLLAEIAKRWPTTRGLSCDLPHELEAARRFLEEEGLADRCEADTADFFEKVPAGGDLYLLSSVLMAWDDERAVRILRNVRHAMGASDARLLIVEPVIPAGNEPSWEKFLDVEALVMWGDSYRSEAEHGALMRAAGLELIGSVPTFPGGMIEARPV
jgi:hypothetical protein